MFFAKKLLYYQNLFPKVFTTPGTFTTMLPPGRYEVCGRGGGGSGGDNGGNSYYTSGGAGGAGAQGGTFDTELNLRTATNITVCVGTGGLVYSQGGNGGGATTQSGPQDAKGNGGKGGGGGMPTYIIVNSSVYYAPGGGGGGGGGGAGHEGRFPYGAGGGAGGGYYHFNPADLSITSFPGRNCRPLTDSNSSQAQVNGENGYQGLFDTVTDYPFYSGAGSRVSGGAAVGSGAIYTGASGGSGAVGYHGFADFAGGGGGGGMGGTPYAGGGQGGRDGNTSSTARAGNGYNHFTTPKDVNTWNTTVGVPGDWGKGGAPGNNGNGGFVLIKRLPGLFPPTNFINCGSVTDVTTQTIDCGAVTDPVTETIDCEELFN